MEESSSVDPNVIFVTVLWLVIAQLPICMRNVGGAKQGMQSTGLVEVSETFSPLNLLRILLGICQVRAQCLIQA